MASTLAEILASQEELVREAAQALPHEFSQCTFSLGPLRQAVYLCLTCAVPRGLCSACSVACHTDHEQVELFPKRNFRCDCPTNTIGHPCTLNVTLEDEASSNTYGQNFKNQFCRCGRPYDASSEDETMMQCLACEDWFHESCCNLRPRPPSRPATPATELCQVTGQESSPDDDYEEDSLAPLGRALPLIGASDYESFICGSCAQKNKTLIRWAGTPGVTMVVRNSACDPWICVSGDDNPCDEIDETEGSRVPSKRPGSIQRYDMCTAKRARGDTSSFLSAENCSAPPPNPFAHKIYSQGLARAMDPDVTLGTGDLFLSDGFRERWCRCSSCLPPLQANVYLLEEEETYEPPEDPDSGLSLEELGMRALETIPRERAINGIHAFNEMRNELFEFLRPFAQEGKIVQKCDVQVFFATKMGATERGNCI